MEDTHDTQPPQEPVEKPSSSGSLVLYSTILIALVGGAMLLLRYDLERTLTRQAQDQQAVLGKMEQRLDALEGQASELSARPAVDQSSLESQDSKIEAVTTSISGIEKNITMLSERVTALENAPELLAPVTPAAPAQEPVAPPEAAKPNINFQNLKIAVLSGSPYQPELDIWYKEHPKSEAYPALKQSAEKGVPTELGLRQQLKAILSQAAMAGDQAGFAEKSVAGRLNQHFSQFISIRKKGSTPAEVDALKSKIDMLPLQQLVDEVGKLPQHDSPALSDWMGQVKARADALSDLTHLESAI